ncbi:MAG TPA: hypothetical protein VMZ28_27330, partial [Kofleriaceae bacterium]|nr:hypothetical protein [Kofleriaceae bacterium]
STPVPGPAPMAKPGVAAPAAPTQLAMQAVDAAQIQAAAHAGLITQPAAGPAAAPHPIASPNPLASIYDTPAPVVRGWDPTTPAPPRMPMGPDPMMGQMPGTPTVGGIPIWLLAVAFVVSAGVGLGITVLLGSLG